MYIVILQKNQYVIPQKRNNKEIKFNVYTNVKILNWKELWPKVLVNLECTYMCIDKQLVKEKQIKIALLPRPFDTFNTNRTRS